jgi:hypothetical protein
MSGAEAPLLCHEDKAHGGGPGRAQRVGMQAVAVC